MEVSEIVGGREAVGKRYDVNLCDISVSVYKKGGELRPRKHLPPPHIKLIYFKFAQEELLVLFILI